MTSAMLCVVDCGIIIDMQWALDYEERLRGIIYAWQGGMENGNAIADVLFGRVIHELAYRYDCCKI